MKKKLSLTLLLLIISIIFGCESKKKDFTLIGKWEIVERFGNNGMGKDWREKISNGRTFEFKANGEVINELGQKGKYQVKTENPFIFLLHISISNNEEYFSVSHQKEDPEKMMLNPTDEKYALGCDEGCTEVYIKD